MAFHFTIPQASIQDTLRYILNFVNKYSSDPFTVQFATELQSSGDKEKFIKRLFDYICTNGYYKLDEDGEEEVWTPAKTIRTRNAAGKFQYDCKKVTILIGSVLKAAGIEPVLKHVYYSDEKGGYKDYTHIYIIVPYPDLQHYITVDPTNNCMWNTEVDHDKATLYFLNGQTQEAAPMNLHLMGNNNQNAKSASLLTMFGESAGCVERDMNAIVGRSISGGEGNIWSSLGKFKYTTVENILHTANAKLLFPARAAFLGLLEISNLLAKTKLKINLAYKIGWAWDTNPSGLHKLWWLLGGTAEAKQLRASVIKGFNVAVPFLGGAPGGVLSGPPQNQYGKIEEEYDRPFIIKDAAVHGINGIGQGPETLAAITAALPILGIILKFIADNKSKEPGAAVVNADPDPVLPPIPDPTLPPTTGFSILDMSSPVNTIVKSVFLMGISGMVSGPSYYILNIFCMGAICFSFIKSFR